MVVPRFDGNRSFPLALREGWPRACRRVNSLQSRIGTPFGPSIRCHRIRSGSVTIFNLAFNPSVITITTGSSVEWTNTDPFTHTTTSDIDLWSQILGPGAVFSTTFAAPGEYTYHCAIHPFMHGQVVVLTSVYLPVIMRL